VHIGYEESKREGKQIMDLLKKMRVILHVRKTMTWNSGLESSRVDNETK
jgi:hypothetical protein